MAKEQEIKEGATPAGDELETPPGEDGINQSGPEGATEEGEGVPSVEIKKRGRKKKRTLRILSIAAVAVIGIGYLYFSGIPDIKNRYEFIPLADKEDITLSEEMLSPFIIPPSKNASGGAIRIDLSVIWNGLASIRFEKKELQIRTSLYKLISRSAEQTGDLNARISLLEEEMGKIFQESLNVRELAIKIKEIKYM